MHRGNQAAAYIDDGGAIGGRQGGTGGRGAGLGGASGRGSKCKGQIASFPSCSWRQISDDPRYIIYIENYNKNIIFHIYNLIMGGRGEVMLNSVFLDTGKYLGGTNEFSLYLRSNCFPEQYHFYIPLWDLCTIGVLNKNLQYLNNCYSIMRVKSSLKKQNKPPKH